MKRKLLDNALTFISGLCVIDIIYTFIEEIRSSIITRSFNISTLKIVITLCLFFFIIYSIYLEKRLLIDTFDILKTLVLNNKLQTLREVVMVANRQYEKKENNFNISKAAFRYTLIPTNSCYDEFDVKYEITILIDKLLLPLLERKKNHNTMKFYAIFDIDNKDTINNIVVSVLLQSNNLDESIQIDVLPHSVTKYGIDQITSCTGLYEIEFQIPEHWLKKIRKHPVNCTISYYIKRNFKLGTNTDENAYNFVIMPANYGKHIENCFIEIAVPRALNINAICQRISIGKNAEKRSDFTLSNNGNLEQNLYKLSTAAFKPQMNAVYFVHLTKLINDTLKETE